MKSWGDGTYVAFVDKQLVYLMQKTQTHKQLCEFVRQKKGRIEMKKLICVILCCLLFSTCSTAFAADPSGDVTLGELQETLLAYLNDNGVDVTIGSEEFLTFITDQLIEGTDKKLASLAEYPLIHAYMAAYKVAAENVISTTGISCNVKATISVPNLRMRSV